jgi:subtilisin family serine protease
MINAMAIRLPAASADQALAALQMNPYVEGIFDHSLSVAAGAICIGPAFAPVPESYTWGPQKIDMPPVHPQWQRAGVMVAVLDTGIDASHPDRCSLSCSQQPHPFPVIPRSSRARG